MSTSCQNRAISYLHGLFSMRLCKIANENKPRTIRDRQNIERIIANLPRDMSKKQSKIGYEEYIQPNEIEEDI